MNDDLLNPESLNHASRMINALRVTGVEACLREVSQRLSAAHEAGDPATIREAVLAEQMYLTGEEFGREWVKVEKVMGELLQRPSISMPKSLLS